MTNIPAATPCVRQHVKPQHYGRFDNSSAATTSHLDVQKLNAGQWVFRQGDPRVAILEVVEGTLALIYRIGDDCEQIVEFAKPGILLGVECEQSYSVSARCISEVQIRPISIGEFNSSASLQLRSSKQLCQRLHALRTHVVRLGQQSASARISAFLLDITDSTPFNMSQRANEKAIKQQDIADYLGLTKETVTRVLSKLRRENVIAGERPGQFRVLSREKLHHIAGNHT